MTIAESALLSERVIGAAIEVHKSLGPGLLESAYQAALCREFELQGISFQQQLSLPVSYKGLNLDVGYRVDFVVDDQLILELRAVERLLGVHEAQLLTYLRLMKKPLGLLINFHVPALKHGIVRMKL